jgi:AcrR family transcriptional regulator
MPLVYIRRMPPLIKGLVNMSVDGDARLPPTASERSKTTRKRRADGLRNRERLLQAAKAAFADVGADVSLEEIARRAGVGIGTLYRHFPTRDAVLEAVYRREVEQLSAAATLLSETQSPAAALGEWMRLFVEYIATKKLMASALATIVGDTSELRAFSGAQLSDAMALLVDRARAAGEIRADADPNDLLRALLGFTYGNANPDWRDSALRLIDILMDGLRSVR